MKSLSISIILVILSIISVILCSCVSYDSAGALDNQAWIGNFENPYLGIVTHDLYTWNGTGYSKHNFNSLCRAYKNNNQSITMGSWKKVTINSINYDNLSEFDTNNNRFIATEPGYYFIHAVIDLSLTSFQSGWISFYKNGSVFTSKISYLKLELSDVIFLDTNDYIELWVYSVSADKTLIGASDATFMSINKIY